MQLGEQLKKRLEKYALLPMLPLKVSALLDSPLIKDDALHLDSILASSVVSEIDQGLLDFDKPLAIPIPLAQIATLNDFPIWAANDLLPNCEVLKSNEYMHKRALPAHLSAGRFRTDKGRHKEMRKPYSMTTTPAVTANCIGNADAIAALLKNVSAIGKKRGSGYGAVREWRIDEIEQYSFLDDGLAMRPLPHSLFPDLKSGQYGGWSSPYWYAPLHTLLVATA